MNFGDTLRQKRRERDMTQEQLSELLGVSTQAVSRWETGVSLPDITLLPTLSNVLEVTSDALLGIDITRKNEEIDRISKEAWERTGKGHTDEGIEILRAGLREYPGSHHLMNALMTALFSNAMYTDNKESFGEIIELGKKILDESTDDTIRHRAIHTMCLTYPHLDMSEEAEKLAEQMPQDLYGRNSLLQHIYKGTKAYEHTQSMIFYYLDSLWLCILMLNHPLDDGNPPYTLNERAEIHETMIKVLELTTCGQTSIFTERISNSYRYAAICYSKLGDTEKALERLKSAAEYAIKFDTEFVPHAKYTSLLLRGSDTGEVSFNSPENRSAETLKIMEIDAFDPIRDTPEFAEITALLTQHAAERK